MSPIPDSLLLALGLVISLAAPPYLSFHLARRKGRRGRRWALAAFLIGLLALVSGFIFGGWLVVLALVALPTPELHPDV